jgi:DNA topoisomerase-2
MFPCHTALVVNIIVSFVPFVNIAHNMASQSLSQTYQKKSDKEHILDNPDTYIGSVENVESQLYVFDTSTCKINEETFNFNPALFKLFDEGIVNCRDHVIRMQTNYEKANKGATENTVQKVTQIQVEIENDTIHLFNNGNGIDIEKHPEYDTWIPELIFAHLRTSTNYNKNEKKITGGKNGFGFKLVLIWSKYGRVETVDHVRGLKYVQEFENNLDIVHKPTITKTKQKPYTRVSFKPDYERLQLTGLSQQMIALFQRRVYDIAGITSKEVKVKFNDELIKINDFHNYMGLYLNEAQTKQKVFEQVNDRWSFGVVLHSEYKQVSFVNGIFTSKGGKHVDYIVNQITKKMVAYIEKKKKVTVKPAIIKEQLFVFINSSIENPSFDSQTKDYLNTPVSKFGSSCEVSDKVIDKLAKMGVMNTSCELSEIKDKKNAKKTDGKVSKTIRGIPKLVDANFAGTSKSGQTMLILCEGDSAKAGIISGLTNDDRNTVGVYPMKGKIFNVRGEPMKKINDNKEIVDIKKILGLETGKSYTSTKQLRYSKIIFMTDQDLDGSHIKGLCINLFAYLWPSLLKLNNFIGFMNTPILKATKLKKVINFYNNGEYENWKAKHNDGKGYKIKYYKGLGTSTSKEFKEYFKDKKIVYFKLSPSDEKSIDKIFNKSKSDERKGWLEQYNRDKYLDTNHPEISYDQFINDELIHFSKYDCDRSIPNMVDGLKTSQRKILYSAFKKNLLSEIKVAQFSGYVSEQSGYHHGEASLNGAIVNMAQNFVGSNNINLLMPNGQFGTRLQGGKDSASERYIFTRLNDITRCIFRKEDDDILKYLDDDGQMVEPQHYVPIIPMVLVNGALGIGTGFSTRIPCYNPLQLARVIKHKIRDSPNGMDYVEDIIPFYRGFRGTIEYTENGRYQTRGVYTTKDNIVNITELPIGIWNEDYIAYLENCLEHKKYKLKDYKDLSTDKQIQIQLIFQNDVEFDKYTAIKGLEKNFKLISSISISNMYLFDSNDKLVLYNNVNEIINDFVHTRLHYYQLRKDNMISKMEQQLKVLSNKYKYIAEILNDTIDLRKKKSSQINEMLEEKEYDKIDNTFTYLIKMPMDSVNEENVERLKKEYEDIQSLLDKTMSTTIVEMYYEELTKLEEMLQL